MQGTSWHIPTAYSLNTLRIRCSIVCEEHLLRQSVKFIRGRLPEGIWGEEGLYIFLNTASQCVSLRWSRRCALDR